MAISVQCPNCGAEWDVSREALFAGRWRDCPFCGGPTGADAVESVEEEPTDG